MKLYEITEAIENFDYTKFIDEETGEFDEQGFNEAINSLEQEKESKIESIGLLIKNLKAEADAIASEVKSLQARKQQKDKQIEWWKNYLSINLNGEKFETSKVSLSFRKSVAVNVIDEQAIPNEYITQEIVSKVNKTEIKKALKNGIEINGAELVENQNIQIK